MALAIDLEQEEDFRRKMADVTQARRADPMARRKLEKGLRCRGKVAKINLWRAFRP